MIEIDIKNYIEESIPNLKDRLCPIFTTNIADLSIVYEFYPISGGILKQTQIQMKIIHSSYDKCKEIEQELLALLDMETNDSFVKYHDTYFHTELAGGGTLYNHGCQLFEVTIIFIIKWR